MTTTAQGPQSAPTTQPQAPLATNFRLPGPTPIPPEVAAAGAWPMTNHRGPEFQAVLKRVLTNLPIFFQTEQPILVFPGSGSAGWEASIANCFSAGDAVAIVSIGNFGDRYTLVANAFGLNVTKIAFEWGQAADPQVVAERISAIPGLKGVMITHNETSTGVMNDLPALARAVHAVAPDALLLVDAVSSLGCVAAPMDELGLDVVFTGSQKGWMTPPGLMMIAFSQRAVEATKTAKLPRFFWDYANTAKSFAQGNPPYTPPISLWYQLDVALGMMVAEGRDNVFARHAALGAYTRQRLRAMGLSLFADPAYASNTVTTVNGPANVDIKSLLKTLRVEDRVVLAGGQGKLDGQVFRIGHMGFIKQADLDEALAALARHI